MAIGSNKVRVDNQMRDAAFAYLDAAKSTGSTRGRTITGGEMNAVATALEAKPLGVTAFDKWLLQERLQSAKLDPAAKKVADKILGKTQPEPPPIVALYAVAIDDAIRNNDGAKLGNYLSTIESNLAPFGGVDGKATKLPATRVKHFSTLAASINDGLANAQAANVLSLKENHVIALRAAAKLIRSHLE